MKHNIKITTILLIIFVLAQFIGIGIIYGYIDQEKSAQEGETVFIDLPIGERPPMEEKTSFIPLVIAIILGTIVLLLLIKYNLQWIWKIWFLFAIVLSLTIAWGAFIEMRIALFLALFFGIWKIFKNNVWVQNFTELFVYGGLAAIFSPVFSLWSVIALLFLISIYDYYAVNKSKHMVTLAKSQTKAKIFAGLMIPYKVSKTAIKKTKEKVKSIKAKVKTIPTKTRTAILGGGDIGFPLIFAGVILKEMGLWQALIIPIFSTMGLAFLFWYGKEDKFYPAMPFISAGCLLGLGIVYLLGFIV